MIKLSAIGQSSVNLDYLAELEFNAKALDNLYNEYGINYELTDIYQLIDELVERSRHTSQKFNYTNYIKSYEAIEVESKYGVVKFLNTDLLMIITDPLNADGIWAGTDGRYLYLLTSIANGQGGNTAIYDLKTNTWIVKKNLYSAGIMFIPEYHVFVAYYEVFTYAWLRVGLTIIDLNGVETDLALEARDNFAESQSRKYKYGYIQTLLASYCDWSAFSVQPFAFLTGADLAWDRENFFYIRIGDNVTRIDLNSLLHNKGILK